MRRSRLLLREIHRQLWSRNKRYCSTFDYGGFHGHLHEIESRLGMRDPIDSQRHYLFPEADDKKIGDAGSVDEVFELYSKKDPQDYRQACQAIATLFHLQKSFRNVLDISINNLYIQYSALNKFNKALHSETPFNDLIENFHSHLHQIPISISSFIFLCLSRLGISMSSPLMHEMLLTFKDQFKDIDPESLSYISVGIRYTVNTDMNFEIRPRTWWCLYLIDALPSLRRHLEKASTPDELNQLTICVYSLRTVMSNELLQLYLSKVKEIILDSDLVLDELLAQRLVKITSVIENILSQEDNDFILKEGDLIPKILFLLKNRLHLLRWVRLVRLSGLLHRINEGSSVIREELLQALRSIYNDEVISNGSYSKLKVMSEILKLEKQSFSFGEWLSLTDKILDNDKGPDFYFHVNDIFQMSSSIDFANKEEEDRFIEILDAAVRAPNENDMLRFFGNYVVHKKHLPRTLLRSPELQLVEKEAIQRLKTSLDDTYILSNFINKFAYILAYTDKQNNIESSEIDKLKRMSHQFDAHSLYKLSFSLGSALKGRQRCPSTNFKAIEKIVRNRIDVISGQNINGKETVVFLKALRRLNLNLQHEKTVLNIQTLIQNLVSNYPPSVELILSVAEYLNSNKVINPLKEKDIFNWMDFVVDNQIYSESYDCIRSILSLAHQMNVDVSANEDFVTLVHKSIYRNIAYESSSSIVQCALALITYRCLSEELIKMIFSLEFMDKIDKEIATYSQMAIATNNFAGSHDRIRINLMRLNRAAHLLHPEFAIPWFHQKFCQENNIVLTKRLQQFQNGARRSAALENSIFDTLSVLFGDSKFVGYGIMSPYFHYIPFEINSEDGIPIEAAKALPLTALRHSQSSNHLKKFALFPIYEENNSGDFELTSRELETLGYNVVPLKEKEWNSMKMSYDDSKIAYLKNMMTF